MADFVLQKKHDFVFAIEDAPEQTFTLPALSHLGLDDVETLSKINDESDIVKRGESIQAFILKFAPELEKYDLGGMEYFEIFNAYGLAMGRTKLGESQASQDS